MLSPELVASLVGSEKLRAVLEDEGIMRQLNEAGRFWYQANESIINFYPPILAGMILILCKSIISRL